MKKCLSCDIRLLLFRAHAFRETNTLYTSKLIADIKRPILKEMSLITEVEAIREQLHMPEDSAQANPLAFSYLRRVQSNHR